MILALNDWLFQVDVETNREKTSAYALDHCECAYCKNYYETIGHTYPGIPGFLSRFGVNPRGPVEVMPFEPTCILACYRVCGKVLHWGSAAIEVAGVPVSVGAGEEGTFLLWLGELELPWVQSENVEDVVSPANLPEFMERMEQMWALRHEEEQIYS